MYTKSLDQNGFMFSDTNTSDIFIVYGISVTQQSTTEQDTPTLAQHLHLVVAPHPTPNKAEPI